MCLLCDCACVCVTADSLQCNWNNFTDRGPKIIQHCGSLWRDLTCFPNLCKQGTLRTGRCYFQCDLQLFCKKEMTTFLFTRMSAEGRSSYGVSAQLRLWGRRRRQIPFNWDRERMKDQERGEGSSRRFVFFTLSHVLPVPRATVSPSSPPELLETRRAARAPDLPAHTPKYDAQTASDSSINVEPRCLKTLGQEVR